MGKTSLISVLNFLYLPNQSHWNFDHEPIKTLNYYFEKLDKNYIVFEIFKNGYFCILMKRDENNRLEYFKINTSYDEVEWAFFKREQNRTSLLDFESISTNLIGKIEELSAKNFKTILYGKSKRDKSIIWLNGDGVQRTFSKIYRYLLNTKLITDEKLKEALLIADKKHEEVREFSSKDSKKIEDIKRHKRRIGKLQHVKKDFFEFKDLVEKYYIKCEKLDSFYQLFYNLFNEESKSLNERLEVLIQDEKKLREKDLQLLEDKRDGFLQNIGAILSQKRNLEAQKDELRKKIDEIEGFDALNLLEISLQNLLSKIANLQYSKEQIKRENFTIESIQTLVKMDEKNIFKLKEKIQNFENLLIHHVSSHEDIKRVINSVFSENVLNLDRSKIISCVQSIDENILDIFDGKIDIEGVEFKDFITIESLSLELKNAQESLKKHEQIKDNILNYQTNEDELEKLNQEKNAFAKKIELIKELPNFKTELSLLNTKLEQSKKQHEHIVNQKHELLKEIEKIKEAIKSKNEVMQKCKDRLGKIKNYSILFEEDLKQYSLSYMEEGCEKSIEKVAKEILGLRKIISNTKIKKDDRFNHLKRELSGEIDDEKIFIKEIEEEYLSMDDKNSAISTLIDSIANDISKPTSNFLTSLEQFEGYLTSINTKFKRYKISDLQTIEIKLHINKNIVNDLRKIVNINKDTLFQDDYVAQIETLKKYISESRKIYLHDLFDLKFVVNGKDVKMSKQTESHGTDRILKITLFILIMRDLIIQDENNKLVIYIDELGEVDDENIHGLIKRCQENNFIPIFAAPDKKPHIDKYYDLIKPKNSDKIIIDESRAIRAKDRV